MKKFLAVVFLCLPAFGQATYSGSGLHSGSATYATPGNSCGPQNGYDCFVQDTSIVNLTMPIPSWGPNTCDSTSLATLSACGNLTGSGYSVTPSDFGNTMVRVTDVNSASTGSLLTTDDDASSIHWNVDDTAFIFKKASTDLEIAMFNPATMVATMTSPRLAVPVGAGAGWSHTINNVFYVLGSTPTQLLQYTVTFGPPSSMTSTLLFDYNNSQCLGNSLNGTGGSFSATWEGTLLSGNNDTVFAMAFSNTGGQDTAHFVAAWTVGQTGCDLYNNYTGTVTHNGAWMGSPTAGGIVADQWGGAAHGGIPDLFQNHSGSTTPGGDYVEITQNIASQGNVAGAIYFWHVGTDSVQFCGNTPLTGWTATHSYTTLGYRIFPPYGILNPGGYIYQIIASGNLGTSGSTQPIWTGSGQTPGADVTDGTVTWRNTGVEHSTENDCTGHGWSGYVGLANAGRASLHTYANPAVTLTKYYSTSYPYPYCDRHYGNANNTANDTSWMFAIAGCVGSTVNQLAGLPQIDFNEGLFISPVNISPGVPNFVGSDGTLGQVRRAFHSYNSGYSWNFDAANGVAMISQTGKFALISSDGMGQFGNLDGTHASCNVGGADLERKRFYPLQCGRECVPDPTILS